MKLEKILLLDLLKNFLFLLWEKQRFQKFLLDLGGFVSFRIIVKGLGVSLSFFVIVNNRIGFENCEVSKKSSL